MSKPVRAKAKSAARQAEQPGHVIAGWREYVSLPDWHVGPIRAKLDTGAKTSAIHVQDIQFLPDGQIRFGVVVREKPHRKTIWVETRPERWSLVKPSTGKGQKRIVCRTRMTLGPFDHDIEVNLVCRKGMTCRMLIGRSAIDKHLLVDPFHTYLLTRKKSRGTKRKK